MRLLTRSLAVAALVSSMAATAQSPEDSINRKHLTYFVAGGAVVYGTSLFALRKLWYSDARRQSFHFFNDWPEWKQVDKAGHFYSAYYVAAGTRWILGRCQVPGRKAVLIGSLAGALLLVPIEIMDGYASSYGASVSDALVNVAGAGFFAAQGMAWGESRIIPKYSYHPTFYADRRPSVLGSNALEEALKDYNGQTYWLSVDLDKFRGTLPKWLNIAVGYGADGMVYARSQANEAAGYHAVRQYYLAIDFDLTAIRTRSAFLTSLLRLTGMVRLPGPAIVLSNGAVSFKPFYF